MSDGKYAVTKTESVPNTNLVNVYFAFGVDGEGSITVSKSIVGSTLLDTAIRLQLSRLKEQREQLAAGGE